MASDLRVGMIRNACKCSLEVRNEPAPIAAWADPFRDPGFSRTNSVFLGTGPGTIFRSRHLYRVRSRPS